jgi:hypothetical protein
VCTRHITVLVMIACKEDEDSEVNSGLRQSVSWRGVG